MTKKIFYLFGISIISVMLAHAQDYSFNLINNDGNMTTTSVISLHQDKIAILSIENGEQSKQHWVLIDPENDMAYIVNIENGEKTAISMELPPAKSLTSAENKKEETIMKASGKTQTIEGYHCEEIIVQNKESQSSMWITQDLPFDFFKIARIFDRLDTEKESRFEGFTMQGVPVSTQINYADGHTEIMTINNISDHIDEYLFSLDGFKIMTFEEALRGG